MNSFERALVLNKVRTATPEELREVFSVIASTVSDSLLQEAYVLVQAEMYRRKSMLTSSHTRWLG